MDDHSEDKATETLTGIVTPRSNSQSDSDNGASREEHDAPYMHDAETVQIDLSPYSLTREQVAEKYAEAGFSVKPRTVSLYAQQGRLRARKVEAKNGLERYLFDDNSVEEDIAKRRKDANSYDTPETVYAAPPEAPTTYNNDANGASPAPAPSSHVDMHVKEIRVAVLETELRMERDARIRAERRAEQEANRSLALAQQIGEYRQRVAMLEAPKPQTVPEPAPVPTPEPDDAKPRASLMRRLFRGD